MTAPFRWGIAGFGWVAEAFALPAIEAAGHRPVAVADPDGGARDRAAALGLGAHAGIEAMIAGGSIDAVYVAAPNDRHRPLVEAAARAGLPILCEKPIAASVAEAEAIAAAVRRHGVFFRTAFDQRHHPAHVAIRDAIAAGRVGRVVAIRIVYACWLGPDWTPATRAPSENWRADPARAGGGALIDLAPHGIDLASFLTGEDVAAVQALLQRRVHDYAVDDGAVAIATTASGVLATLHVAYNHPEHLPRRRLEIVGTDGMITAIDTMGQEPGGSVTISDAAADGGAETIRFDADASPFTRQLAAFAAALERREPFDAGLARDLAHFRLLASASEDRTWR